MLGLILSYYRAMGNGQMKGWPPAGVVTVVLACGRTEEYKRPILAGDVMLLHPRHHVVKPDFFRATTVVVLRPEEVLMPGHKFLLVPFRTVYRKLRKRGEVINVSSKSGESAAGEGRPREDSCSPACRNDSVELGKKGLGGGPPATRPSGGHAASTLKKSSSTTTSQPRTPRRKPQALKFSRNARRKASIDVEDRPRRRTSLNSQRISQMRKHYESLAKTAENKSIKSADFRELEPFKPADITECDKLESTVAVTKKAASLDLSVPEYESFKTPVMLSPPEEGLETFVDVLESFELPATSVRKNESLEAMYSPEWKQCSREPLSTTPPAVANGCAPINERMDSPRPDSGQKEESSSEPPSLMAPSDAQCVSVRTMIRTLEDQKRRENYILRFNKSPPAAASLDRQSMQHTLTVKIAEYTHQCQQAIKHGGRRNGLGQQSPSSPSGPKQFASKEPERSLTTTRHAISPRGRHDILGQQLPSSSSGQNQQRILTMNGRALSHSGKGNGLGHHPPSEENQLRSPKPERSLSRINKPQQEETKDQVGYLQELQVFYSGVGNDKFVHVKVPLENGLFNSSVDPQVERKPFMYPVEQAETSASVQQQSPITVVETLGNGPFKLSAGPQVKPKGMAVPVKQPETKASLQQQSPMTLVKAWDNGLFKSSADPKVEPKALPVQAKQLETRASVQQQAPVSLVKRQKSFRRNKLIDHFCFSSSHLQSPLHVQTMPASDNNPEKKTRVGRRLKLMDHLKLEHSPEHDQNNILKQPDAPKANNVPLPQFRQFPMPESVTRKDFGIARQEFLAFQLSQAIRNQFDSSALAPKDVNRMSTKTPIEDKFLKLPPVSFFRHRRIRTRSRITTVTNWKPKLSPLVEFSP